MPAPPAAPVPPVSSASRPPLVIPEPAATPPEPRSAHPLAIELPTARAHRDERRSLSQQVDAVRRAADPNGDGRTDVDWLGRARADAEQTPAAPEVLPPAAQPSPPDGAHAAIHDAPTDDIPVVTGPMLPVPPTIADRSAVDEPPSFTDLLRQPVPPPVRHRVPPQLPPLGAPAPEAEAHLPAEEASVAAKAARVPSEEVPVVAEAAPVPPEASPAVPERAPTFGEAPEDVRTQAFTLPPSTSAPPRPEESAPSIDEILGLSAPPAPNPPAPIPPASRPSRTAPLDTPAPSPFVPPSARPGASQSWAAPGDSDTASAADIDQSEWDGRETSDTSAIRAVFGTGALHTVDAPERDPFDNQTRMMPVVDRAPGSLPPEAAPRPVQFMNDGFARLQSEGRRGKQLLVWGAIVIIVVMIVAVFLLTRWIIGGDISNHQSPSPSPSSSSQSATPKAAGVWNQSSDSTGPLATSSWTPSMISLGRNG
ncbi:hypothetical protein [Curtobacterium ammoniigenes]|uniref:hypothetical protein n=1 Tax=Curtobacterium ammoniigenes TaxID=395387 RepID=UPI0012EDD7E9|nr:hypothetical protein [Curtobacterium ammoniigenes]